MESDRRTDMMTGNKSDRLTGREPDTKSGHRIGWIDAMRGFSMLVVVLGHVFVSMGVGGYDSFLSICFLTFRMPLFFFVSGFFAYRALPCWTPRGTAALLGRKVRAQLIGMTVFLSLFDLVTTGHVDLLAGFSYYWFTVALFQMFLIYLVTVLLSRLIRRDIVISALVLISCIFIVILATYDGYSYLWNYMCWNRVTKYMQFYTLGVICSRWRDTFLRTVGSRVFLTVCGVGWAACLFLMYWTPFRESSGLLHSFVHDIAVRYLGLGLIVSLFYTGNCHTGVFNTVIGGDKDAGSARACVPDIDKPDINRGWRLRRALRFIGRRTLDIYYLHYFFIPDLSFMKPWFAGDRHMLGQLLVGMAVTVVVTGACLGVSCLLRRSRFLSRWLLGASREPPGARSEERRR